MVGLIFVLLFASFSFVFAVDDNETDPVDLAFSCLNSRTEGGCTSFAPDERAFIFATIGKCYDEIVRDNITNGGFTYWSSSRGANVKYTAITTLALKGEVDTTSSETWLLSQTMSPPDIDWFLQVDTTDLLEEEVASCSVKYNNNEYGFKINYDKTITQLQNLGGSCLSISSTPYNNLFLKVKSTDQNCLNYEYSVTCDSRFLVSLIFKKQGSNVIHITKGVEIGIADETKPVKINSLCFKQGNSCNYEGSLWATFVLQETAHDISAFMPYLIIEADEAANKGFLPEAFLYLITAGNSQYYTDLLSRKDTAHGGYWPEGANIFTRYYNTALAGMALPPADLVDTNIWLLEDQSDSGCWGTTLDTAFILYSFFGEGVLSDQEECQSNEDCTTFGYICVGGQCVPPDEEPSASCLDTYGYCMSSAECLETAGNEWSYDCPSTAQVCCSSPPSQGSCADVGGDICTLEEQCLSGGVERTDVTDLPSGGVCCVGGRCQLPSEPEDSCFNVTRASCKDYCDTQAGESKDEDYECPGSKVCCVRIAGEPWWKLWWIWALLGLIVLVLVGILFRNQLQMFWMKITSGRGKGSSVAPRGGPRFPPSSGSRNIFPPSNMMRPGSRPPRASEGGDVEDVLKKLRDMGS